MASTWEFYTYCQSRLRCSQTQSMDAGEDSVQNSDIKPYRGRLNEASVHMRQEPKVLIRSVLKVVQSHTLSVQKSTKRTTRTRSWQAAVESHKFTYFHTILLFQFSN